MKYSGYFSKEEVARIQFLIRSLDLKTIRFEYCQYLKNLNEYNVCINIDDMPEWHRLTSFLYEEKPKEISKYVKFFRKLKIKFTKFFNTIKKYF